MILAPDTQTIQSIITQIRITSSAESKAIIVPTSDMADNISRRYEEPPRQKTISKMFKQLIRPAVAARKFIETLLKQEKKDISPSFISYTDSISSGAKHNIRTESTRKPPERPLNENLFALEAALKGLETAESLKELTGFELVRTHDTLASDNGDLRRLVTALTSVCKCSQNDEVVKVAQTLLKQPIEGLAFSEFGSTGLELRTLLGESTPGKLDTIAKEICEIASKIDGIREMIKKDLDQQKI